jgi:Putative SAM-dependent methyltransferase
MILVLFFFAAVVHSILEGSRWFISLRTVTSFVLKQPNHDHIIYRSTRSTPRYAIQSQYIELMQRSRSKNSTSNCCVVASTLFPNATREISERLSLPIITMDDVYNANNKMTTLSHAIVLEPYSFDINRVQTYAIAIVPFCFKEDTLSSRKKNQKGNKAIFLTKPLYIDFMPLSNSKLGRRTLGDTGPELLLKAVRPNRIRKNSHLGNYSNLNNTKADQRSPVVIYDLTAGFGQDSLLLAHAIMNMKGRVHMVERNPIIATLLLDAMRRLQLIAATGTEQPGDDTNNQQKIAQQLVECLSVECDDGINVLTKILQDVTIESYDNNTDTTTKTNVPDIIYLDPMFPTRKKSASVKKNMQILHSLLVETQPLLHDDTCDNDDTTQQFCMSCTKDAEESLLLRMSYQVATSCVVVKRPINVPSISFACNNNDNDKNNASTQTTVDIKPSYQIVGTINRWDVYNKL